MKTATVRQIRNAFPSVLRLIRNGESVSITSRRQVVATLSPPAVQKAARQTRPWANLDVRLAELLQQPMLPLSGADLLAPDRDRSWKVLGLRRYVVSIFPRVARRQHGRSGRLSKTPSNESCADTLAAMRVEQCGAPLCLAWKLSRPGCNDSTRENRSGSQGGKFHRNAARLARRIEDRERAR